MTNSPFKELFGELEEINDNEMVESKEKGFKFLLFFFLSLIVLSLTFIFSFAYFELSPSPVDEILGETVVVQQTKEPQVGIAQKTSLDSFVSDFVNGSYKVDDSGGFGYIYGESKDGAFFLGREHTYFDHGRIALFTYSEDLKVFWSDYNRKFILVEKTKEYFPVVKSSDFYYRNYLGQHILQDLIDDYLRNKDFIPQLNENTWAWEWSFYTPKAELKKHTMQAEIIMNLENNYLSGIKLFNEDGDEVCTFEFSFEKIEGLDFTPSLGNYEKIEEVDVNSLM